MEAGKAVISEDEPAIGVRSKPSVGVGPQETMNTPPPIAENPELRNVVVRLCSWNGIENVVGGTKYLEWPEMKRIRPDLAGPFGDPELLEAVEKVIPWNQYKPVYAQVARGPLTRRVPSPHIPDT